MKKIVMGLLLASVLSAVNSVAATRPTVRAESPCDSVFSAFIGVFFGT